jgi:hypothetical protein
MTEMGKLLIGAGVLLIVIGGVLVLSGFALGLWVFFAGIVLLARSVIGFVSEGRARR